MSLPQRGKIERGGEALRRIGLAAALSLAAVLIFLSPTATTWLEFDRDLVGSGEWWRLLTSHLTHWSLENLFWNVAVFALLAGLCEAAGRWRFVVCLIASALAIPGAVWLLAPQISVYRGLSGVDSALFGLVAAGALRAAWAHREWRRVVMIGLLGVALAAKIGVEHVTGRALFVDSAAAGFVPMPLAHAVGAAVGALVGFTPSSGRSADYVPAGVSRAERVASTLR